jgi:hypothetical protein
MSLGHYFMVAVLIALVAIIVRQLPHAIDMELDMADASAQNKRASVEMKGGRYVSSDTTTDRP